MSFLKGLNDETYVQIREVQKINFNIQYYCFVFKFFFCVGGIIVDLRLVKKDLFMFTGNKNFSLIFKNSKLQLYVSKRHDIVFLGHPCSHKLRTRFSLRIEPDI